MHNGERKIKNCMEKLEKMPFWQKRPFSEPVIYGLQWVIGISSKLMSSLKKWHTSSWFYENCFWDISPRLKVVSIPITLLYGLLELINGIFEACTPSNFLKPRFIAFRIGMTCHINFNYSAFYSDLKLKIGFLRNPTFGDHDFVNIVSGACTRPKMTSEHSQ